MRIFKLAKKTVGFALEYTKKSKKIMFSIYLFNIVIIFRNKIPEDIRSYKLFVFSIEYKSLKLIICDYNLFDLDTYIDEAFHSPKGSDGYRLTDDNGNKLPYVLLHGTYVFKFLGVFTLSKEPGWVLLHQGKIINFYATFKVPNFEYIEMFIKDYEEEMKLNKIVENNLKETFNNIVQDK